MFMKKKNYDIKKYRKILNGNDNFSIWSDKKKWNFKWRDEKIKSDEKKTNEREYWKNIRDIAQNKTKIILLYK